VRSRVGVGGRAEIEAEGARDGGAWTRGRFAEFERWRGFDGVRLWAAAGGDEGEGEGERDGGLLHGGPKLAALARSRHPGDAAIAALALAQTEPEGGVGLVALDVAATRAQGAALVAVVAAVVELCAEQAAAAGGLGALAGDDPGAAEGEGEGAIGVGDEADACGAVGLTCARPGALPAAARGAGDEQEEEQGREGAQEGAGGRAAVAHCAAMVRRRRPNVPSRPTQIGPAIWSLVRTHVPEDTIQILRVREIWPKVANRALTEHAWPAALSGEELIIDVQDSQWLHELTYMRQAILQKLALLCPHLPLSRLRLRLASRDRPPMPRRVEPTPAPPSIPPPLAGPLEPATVAAIEGLQDVELRALLTARLEEMRAPARR